MISYKFFLGYILLVTACGPSGSSKKLAKMSLVSGPHHSEIISDPQQLKKYENLDFKKNQPYQKICRIFQRDQSGNAKSILTSYYPSGSVKQSLEGIDGRALGLYEEWHENGIKHLEVSVKDGIFAFGQEAENSWIFDGFAFLWNEEGNLFAQINYLNGKLHGDSLFYFPDGNISLQKRYISGIRDGAYSAWYPSGEIKSKEIYQRGKLISGIYFDKNKEEISKIENGNGFRIKILDDLICYKEYKGGLKEGEVRFLEKNQLLKRVYHTKDDAKYGEEIVYYPNSLQKSLSVEWIAGKMHGLIKTWYPDGSRKSQGEMQGNYKQGIHTAWYKNGKVMCIEEYEKNRVMRGTYFRMQDGKQESCIESGNGVATIYDEEGRSLHKTAYEQGKPVIK